MFRKNHKRIGVALVGTLVSLSSLFGALPAGYTQLAFLESSGTQYIDTGVVFGKTNGFSITYQVVAPDLTGNQIICGSRNDDGDTRCILGCNSPVYRTYMTNGTDVVTNSFRQSLAYVGWNDLKFSMSTGHRVDDYTKGVADVNFRNSGTYDCRHAKSGGLDELTAQTAPFYLFAGKMVAPTETMYYGRCRIWEARISAGEDVIRHFVAARRESDSELGMYDLVNDVFYTNQGTGTFKGGEPVQGGGRDAYTRLGWLESTGGQFIDTGVTFTDAHGFAVTYQTTARPQSGGNQIVCGSRASSGHTRCMVGSNDRVGVSTYTNYAYIGWNTLLTSYAVRDESEGTVTLNYLNSRTWDCRGQLSGTLDAALVAQTGTFYLFSGNMAYSGGSRIGCRCRIMSFTMTRGNEVVMDLIPARRKVDGKPGMYDVLNDVFYVNQGGMDFVEGEPLFPDGYIGLDFIESTGTQYINTGVTFTDAHGFAAPVLRPSTSWGRVRHTNRMRSGFRSRLSQVLKDTAPHGEAWSSRSSLAPARSRASEIASMNSFSAARTYAWTTFSFKAGCQTRVSPPIWISLPLPSTTTVRRTARRRPFACPRSRCTRTAASCATTSL